MAEPKRDYYQMLETLIGIFTIEKGKIKILLEKKNKEPLAFSKKFSILTVEK